MTGTRRRRDARAGATLVELMVAVVILSVGVLGLFGAFRYISRSVFVSRAQTLATNLAQERVEVLKNISYYSLLITTSALPHPDHGFQYDTSNYPPETITIGGIRFTRYTYVEMAELQNGVVNTVGANYPDTGLKQITTTVVWKDGPNHKKWTLTNLLENPNVNPLDATVSGTVSRSGGGVVPGALVMVEQNPDWTATADTAGYYSFSVYHGTYTIRASSAGFFDASATGQIVSRGQNKTVNLTMQAMSSGTIQGNAWYNSDVVISQVVANTVTVVGDGTMQSVEYVELFNPTTYPINVGTTATAYKNISLMYYDDVGNYRYDSSGYGAANRFKSVNLTTYVPAGHYYLIANASHFFLAGEWVVPDAYYDDEVAPNYPNYIKDDQSGIVGLYRWSPGMWLDYVGWADNNSNAWFWEGSVIPNEPASNGLGTPAGRQLVRVSSPGINAADLPTFGRAYDSNSNARDFLYAFNGYTPGIQVPPRTTAHGAFPVIAGKVPTSVFVAANDPNSGAVSAATVYVTSAGLSLPYTQFRLTGVSTGTWTVTLANASYMQTVGGVVVTDGATTRIPNAATTPVWPSANRYAVAMSSTAYGLGFVRGTVRNDSAQPVQNIIVQGGGDTKTTGTSGVYMLVVSTGTVTIIANPNNDNPSYVQSIKTADVSQGELELVDHSLDLGGRVSGYITTGTTPLANAVVAIMNGGSQAGSGTTNASGVFMIRNVPEGTYDVEPILEAGQDSNPNSLPATVSSSGTVWVGTFTVSGAFGSIAGTVTDAAGLVTSGALLVASTGTIAATPPSIAGSSAPALSPPLYMVSSKADGTYSLPVRGGFTYRIRAWVPAVSASGAVSVQNKEYTGIAVTPSATTTQDVSFP